MLQVRVDRLEATGLQKGHKSLNINKQSFANKQISPKVANGTKTNIDNVTGSRKRESNTDRVGSRLVKFDGGKGLTTAKDKANFNGCSVAVGTTEQTCKLRSKCSASRLDNLDLSKGAGTDVKDKLHSNGAKLVRAGKTSDLHKQTTNVRKQTTDSRKQILVNIDSQKRSATIVKGNSETDNCQVFRKHHQTTQLSHVSKQTTKFRKRVSLTRLESNRNENSGVCQVLSPSCIDRSEKVRECVVDCYSGRSNRSQQGCNGGNTSGKQKYRLKSTSAYREGKSVLCNITRGCNLPVPGVGTVGSVGGECHVLRETLERERHIECTEKIDTVKTDSHAIEHTVASDYHALERLTHRPLCNTDVNVVLNGNTVKYRSFGENGLKSKGYPVSGRENGKGAVVKNTKQIGRSRNNESCQKKSGEKENRTQSSNLAHAMDREKKVSEKKIKAEGKRQLKGSKIAVLTSRVSEGKKSVTPVRKTGRVSPDCRVVSEPRTQGSLLEREITKSGGNGTNCTASRRREIGDGLKCTAVSEDIAGLSEGKVFHSVVDPESENVPEKSVTIDESENSGKSVNEQTTLADDNLALHAPRAERDRVSLLICQRSEESEINRDDRYAERERRNCGVSKTSDYDIVDLDQHGLIAGVEAGTTDERLGNGEFSLSLCHKQDSRIKQGNKSNSVCDRTYDQRFSGKLCSPDVNFRQDSSGFNNIEHNERSPYSSGISEAGRDYEQSFSRKLCSGSTLCNTTVTPKQNSSGQGSVTTVSEIGQFRNEVKSDRRQKQTGIPSYKGVRNSGKTPDLKNKKLPKREKDSPIGNTGDIGCVKKLEYDSQVSSISASTCNARIKSHTQESEDNIRLENENETKSLSGARSKDASSRIPKPRELLLISDSVSYLVSLPRENDASSTGGTHLHGCELAKSDAPEDPTPATDANKKSLGASVLKPRGFLSFGDKERKGEDAEASKLISNTEDCKHFIHETENSENVIQTEDYKNVIHDAEDCKNVIQSDTADGQNVTNCDTNLSDSKVRNYNQFSTSVHYDYGITDDNDHVVDIGKGDDSARCLSDQSSLKNSTDQNIVMATKAGGLVGERNMIAPKHKGERLKRQTGQASLQINLPEKSEVGSGASLPDSVAGKKQQDSTTRLMRPTISSAIRSSPEMAKKLIPKARSPTSPDSMFSPPMMRKNNKSGNSHMFSPPVERKNRKSENFQKGKGQVVSSDVITCKTVQDKTRRDKTITSPRSSISSNDASVRSGVSEKGNVSKDDHKARKGASKTRSNGASSSMHSNAACDSSARSKKGREVNTGEASESEVECQSDSIHNQKEGKCFVKHRPEKSSFKSNLRDNSEIESQQNEALREDKCFPKDVDENSCVNFVSDTDDSKVDKSEKRNDGKTEKTRKNVKTYESGVESASAIDSNRSSSERENSKMNKSCSSSVTSLRDKNKKSLVSKNSIRKDKGEPCVKTHTSDTKHSRKPLSDTVKVNKRVSVAKVGVKTKELLTDMSETDKGQSSDTDVKGGSASSMSSAGSKSLHSKAKVKSSSSLKIERVSSRSSLKGEIQRKALDNKSTSQLDRLNHDKTDTLKTSQSTINAKKTDGGEKTSAVKQRLKTAGSSVNNSERSTSNSPRSSMIEDDTDSAVPTMSKPVKKESKLPKASKLPMHYKSVEKSKLEKEKRTDKLVKSGTSSVSVRKLDAKKIVNSTSVHSKNSACDSQKDSKSTSKKKNLKENINRKQREMSPMFQAVDTDVSEFSALEDIPSASDFDTDVTTDAGPSLTKDKEIPKSDQSGSDVKQRNLPKSLTSPKVETRKGLTKLQPKKSSPLSPSLNARTPGSPRQVKKSPTSPAASRAAALTSPKSPKVESKVKSPESKVKSPESKLPKKFVPKKPQPQRKLHPLMSLESRYTAEKLELMRLKIPAEMDFSDVSRPSTREGSVDSRFDDDRWSVCSDISSISRASSVSLSAGARVRGSKVPTRLTGPASRIKPVVSRVPSHVISKIQPPKSNTSNQSLSEKQIKPKDKIVKTSNVPFLKKTGTKKISPTDEKCEKVKMPALNVEDSMSRSSLCSEWLEGNAPLMPKSELTPLNDIHPDNLDIIQDELSMKTSADVEMTRNSDTGDAIIDKNNFAAGMNSSLTTSSDRGEIVSDSRLVSDSTQDSASKLSNVNTAFDAAKHKLHSQSVSDTIHNEGLEGKYGSVTHAGQVMITDLANGDIGSANQITVAGNVTDLIPDWATTGLSSEDEFDNLCLQFTDKKLDKKLTDEIGEGGHLSPSSAGQSKHTAAKRQKVPFAVESTSSMLDEACTISLPGSTDSDNTSRHSEGSDHTNNKHSYLSEGGAQYEIPHPTELIPTPTSKSGREIENVINTEEDGDKFQGECGMLLKLSQVKEIKAEGRLDISRDSPMTETDTEKVGSSLTGEITGCDKNGEDFERRYDSHDKIAINKPVHISGVEDKPERGCSIQTAGVRSNVSTAYDSPRQGSFDTFVEAETETGPCNATQGRHGVIEDRDRRPGGSIHSVEERGLGGAADGSGYDSGETDIEGGQRIPRDRVADGTRLVQQTGTPHSRRDGCQMKSENEDNGHLSKCEIDDSNNLAKGEHDVTTSQHVDMSREICAEVMNSAEEGDSNMAGQSVVRDGCEASHIVVRSGHNSEMVEIKHHESQKHVTDTESRMWSAEGSSGVTDIQQNVQSSAIQIEVNCNRGHFPSSHEAKLGDTRPTSKHDSQTLGRIETGRGDKLSSAPKETRLIIDKRNLNPDGYDENMPIQRRILINSDSLKSKGTTVQASKSITDKSGKVMPQTSVHMSKLVIKDSKLSVSKQPQNVKLKVAVSKFESQKQVSKCEPKPDSQKDSTTKPATRLQTYKPVHKSDFLKQSSVRKSLASRAQQKTISARFSQGSSSAKVNKVTEQSEKTSTKDSTPPQHPHVSTIEFSFNEDMDRKNLSSSGDELVSSLPHESSEEDTVKDTCMVTSSDSVSYDMQSVKSESSEGETMVKMREIEVIHTSSDDNQTDRYDDTREEIGDSIQHVTSNDIDYCDSRKERIVKMQEIEVIHTKCETPVTTDSEMKEEVIGESISFIDETSNYVTIEKDNERKLEEDENMSDSSVRSEKSKVPPTVSPKPIVSVSADGKIDLSYKTKSESANDNSQNQGGVEPRTITSEQCEQIDLGSGLSDTNAISDGSTTENHENVIESISSSKGVNKFENELASIAVQTVVTSETPPLEESIKSCSFDKPGKVSSPKRSNETVSKALKRSTGTTTLNRWQSVKNKFLGKPSPKPKEKVTIISASSVEKTVEDFEVCLEKKQSCGSKDKADEKFVDSSRVSEIRRTLSNRLAKSPLPETPPSTPSPSPTRKYKWIREGGIWKKKFLSDSGESESEAEDYGRELQDEKLFVNISVDRASSSESECRQVKSHDYGSVNYDMDTSASEIEDGDIFDNKVKVELQIKSKQCDSSDDIGKVDSPVELKEDYMGRSDSPVKQCDEVISENEGVCTDKVDFNAVVKHFRKVASSSQLETEKVRCGSPEKTFENKRKSVTQIETKVEKTDNCENISDKKIKNEQCAPEKDNNQVRTDRPVTDMHLNENIPKPDVATHVTYCNYEEEGAILIIPNAITSSQQSSQNLPIQEENTDRITNIETSAHSQKVASNVISETQEGSTRNDHIEKLENNLIQKENSSGMESNNIRRQGVGSAHIAEADYVNKQHSDGGHRECYENTDKNIETGHTSYDNRGTPERLEENVCRDSRGSRDDVVCRDREHSVCDSHFDKEDSNSKDDIASHDDSVEASKDTRDVVISEDESQLKEESAGDEMTSHNVDINKDKSSTSVSCKTPQMQHVRVTDSPTGKYVQVISEEENQKHCNDNSSYATKNMSHSQSSGSIKGFNDYTNTEGRTISHSESSGSINLNDLQTDDEVDRTVVLSEMQEKFIPIEASPVLHKKCVVADHISLSAAESCENVSVLPAEKDSVPESLDETVLSASELAGSIQRLAQGSADSVKRLSFESASSRSLKRLSYESGDSESGSGYYGYDDTIHDDDLDTTMTDEDADDLCELVITEDLDDTVVGADNLDVPVGVNNNVATTESDMAYSTQAAGGRRYSYAGRTTMSTDREEYESGYWSTRKAFWEKDSHELLAEISEIEEHGETFEESEQEIHRSHSASPVKLPQEETTPRISHRRKTRRSLSLPSGTLSYGDVKITYKDGHFVAEPPEDQEEEKSKSLERCQRDSVCSAGTRTTSSESIAESSGNEDTLSIVSDLALREELLAWLNQHLVDSDVFLGQSLDWNSNHVGSDSSAHSSQNDVAMIPASSTLPRRTGRDNDGNRPVSVDEIHLLRNAYFQEQLESKFEGQCHSGFSEHVNQDSLLSDPRNGRRRLSVQDNKSERSRSKSPNFFQRMLSKRKSFSEKGAKPPIPQDEPPRKDTSIVRRMSLKSLFKRKTRKCSEESDGPPIAAFLKDEDIGAVSSLPNSPFTSKRVHRVQTDPQIQIRRTIDRCDDQSGVTGAPINQSASSLRVGMTRPEVPPRRKSSTSSMKQNSLTDRSSGEFSISEYDMGSEDVLTSRSVSPAVVDTERDGTGHSGKLVRGEITSNSNDSGIQHDAVMVSSSESLKISTPDSSAPVTITSVKLRKTPSPKQERPKSDITVRWADLLEQVKETDVTYRKDGQMRKRPRPKSDLEDIMFVDEGLDDDDDVISVKDTKGRSRSVCDLGKTRNKGGSSMFSENMRAFGSIGNLRTSDSLRSLRLVDGFQFELQRSSQDVRLVSAKVVKSRRMSTPHPIKSRGEKIPAQPRRKAPVMVRSHSMPENLDKLHRKKNFLSLIGSDNQSLYSQRSGGDDSSDESEYSVEFTLHEKCPSTRSSQIALATLDETQEETMTYAEALWDHVTMDTDELGFRAGDQIRVTDMMDKDWWFGCTEQRRGWFPAAFVRLWVNQERFEDIHSQGMEVSQQMRNHGVDTNQGRANVVNEIIHAEREYVKHLRDVVEGYLKQAKKRPEMFPEEKISIIFGNIEEIYNFATRFIASLEKAYNTESPHMSTVGQVFLRHSHSFEIYSDYCNNHPGSGEEVKELYRNKKYRHFFEACRLLQEMIEIPLEGFLLTPVQKICKYHLQLNELLKYTPPDHVDYSHARAALDSMKKIATLINERKRKMESIEKIATWQAAVDDWEGEDILQHSSELIYSGDLHKINSSGWSQERYFFLFDHQVVYCKKDLLKKNGFGYKGRIDLDHSEIIPVTDGKDTQYNVTVRHAWKIHDTLRDKWYLLVAKTEQIKQRWLKAFEDERKRVKEDQENNFNIPTHLKQSAINNLKQKSHLGKPKAKRKAARSTSLRQTKKPESVIPTSCQGTLPRKKQQDSLGDINQSKKLQWFFLGQGKKK